jgi:hypothetical protein
MNGRRRLLIALVLSLVFSPLTVSALTPNAIDAILAAIEREEPGAVVLEIDMESNWDGGIVSVETSTGSEYYLALASVEILERERGRSGRGETRILERLEGTSELRDLAAVYRRTLDYLASHSRYDDINDSFFDSIEYDVEFGRLIVETVFEGPFGTLDIYVDPLTGSILESEWDD